MIHTLDDDKPGFKVDNQSVQIDSSVLFLQCTTLAQQEDGDITTYFKYEMTPVPTSLFKDSFMRKIDIRIGKNNKKGTEEHHIRLCSPVITGKWVHN